MTTLKVDGLGLMVYGKVAGSHYSEQSEWSVTGYTDEGGVLGIEEWCVLLAGSQYLARAVRGSALQARVVGVCYPGTRPLRYRVPGYYRFALYWLPAKSYPLL